MENLDLYEVSRDEYAGFISQLKKDMMDVIEATDDKYMRLELHSQTTGKHLSTRKINTETGEETYYIFNLAEANECVPPKAVQKFTLETQEEVQAFFDILTKIQKGENYDGDLS